jgi:hypothetical protein
MTGCLERMGRTFRGLWIDRATRIRGRMREALGAARNAADANQAKVSKVWRFAPAQAFLDALGTYEGLTLRETG